MAPAGANTLTGTAGNGQDTRPFYVFGHNPNTCEAAKADMAAGANALEPDLMRFPTNLYNTDQRAKPPKTIDDFQGPTGLFVYHDAPPLPVIRYVGSAVDRLLTAEQYFDCLHAAIKGGANLALIALDTKSPAAAWLGEKNASGEYYAQVLVDEIGVHLNYDGVNVPIIYSAGTRADMTEFIDHLCFRHTPNGSFVNQGVMVDGENDPEAVVRFLTGHLDRANLNGCDDPYNVAFGNGSLGLSLGLAPNVMPSIMHAAQIRSSGEVQSMGYANPGPVSLAIPYAFPVPDTISTPAMQGNYIKTGLDGEIPDLDLPNIAPNQSQTSEQIGKLKSKVTTSAGLYMATSADNPFSNANVESYSLTVQTRDVALAYTNNQVSVSLQGSLGTSNVTIDCGYKIICSQGHTDYITIPSKNLGTLQSIHLSMSTGYWLPGSITVNSRLWGPQNCSTDFTGFQVGAKILGTNVDPTRVLTGQCGPGHGSGPPVNLMAATLRNSNFAGSDLSGATFDSADLQGSSLVKTNLTGASLHCANLRYANMQNALLTGGAKLSCAHLDHVDLTGADMTGADLSGTSLTGANLTKATLTGANLNGSDLSKANLTGVVAGGITGTPTSLPSSWALHGGYFIGPGADLTGANLGGANLGGIDLTGATLTGVSSGGITGTPIGLPSGWKLLGGYLVGPGANLSNADLTGLDLTGATLTGVVSGGITGTPIGLPSGWKLLGGYLVGPGADLTNADLTSVDLTGATLTGDTLAGAKFAKATLTGVISGGIKGTPASLPSAWHFTRGYLIGPGANLSGASIKGNLGAFFMANVSGANLTGANLTADLLLGANFTGANLTGANLTLDTWDSSTNFTGAILKGATLPSPQRSEPIWNNTICPGGTSSNAYSPQTCLGH